MPQMKRYAISDSRLLGGADRLPDWVEGLENAGVELVQIREKSLPASELARLVVACLARCRNIRLLVNGRVDVALACGAHGAHLPGGSLPPSVWSGVAPRGFMFGVSCHSVEEAIEAQKGGANFVVAAPVFDPLSKAATGPALGVDGLRRICLAVTAPVYALGGVTGENAAQCVDAGAAGIAGITLFQG